MKAAGLSSRPAVASVRLTPRRVQLLEAIAEQLGRPLSPVAALGLMLARGPEALAALKQQRALEAARPKPGPPDPDAWPSEASPGAVRLYRQAVRALLGRPGAAARGWYCECGSECGDLQQRPAGRRWWECPTCPRSASLRRKVRALRRGWSWPNAEARAKSERERSQLDAARVRDEATIRAALAKGRRAARGWVESLACEAAGIERLPHEAIADSEDWQRFACMKCHAEWRPFDAPGVDHRGELSMHPSECRAPRAWWECPKGCNSRSLVRVLRLASNQLERSWLGRVDAAACARLERLAAPPLALLQKVRARSRAQ